MGYSSPSFLLRELILIDYNPPVDVNNPLRDNVTHMLHEC